MKYLIVFLLSLVAFGCATTVDNTIDAPQWVIEETFCAGAEGLLSDEEQTTYPQ